MGNLGETLKKKMKSMGIERQVEAVGVVEMAQKEISKHIPEDEFEVVSFSRGVLKISTKNAAVAAELNVFTKKFLLKNQIKRINIRIN